MNKYFLPVYHSDLKPWIKWWVLKRLNGGESTLKAVTLSEGTLTKVDKSKALRIKEYYGNTVQDGTPTPESPVPVQTISGNITFTINGGDYKLDLKSKNLFDENTYNNSSLYAIQSLYFSYVKMPDSFKRKFYGNMTLTGTQQNLVFGFSNSNNSISTRILSNGTISSNVLYDFTNAENVYLIIGNSQQVNITRDIPLIYNNYKIMISENANEPYESYYNYELCKIGDYKDKLKRAEGKNYCYTNASEWELGQYGVNGEKTEFPQRARISTLIPVQPNTTIYVHTNNTNYNFVLRGYGQNKEIITNYGQVTNGNTITTTNVYYLGVTIMHISDTSSTAGQTILNNLGETIFPMICLNSEINKSYEPYGNNWYIEKNIGKVILNGTENWIKHGAIASWFYYDGVTNGYFNNAADNFALTNYFSQKPYSGVVNLTNGEFAYGSNDSGATHGLHRLVCKDTNYTVTQDFKDWLSKHNVNLYYVLATPTTETITNTNLISQLNALYEFYVNSSTVTISNNSEITLEVLLEYYGR